MSLRQTASRYVVGGLALAALLALIVWATAPAAAQSSSYAASLSGGAEVPPVATSAGGSFSASYDGSVITFTLTSDACGDRAGPHPPGRRRRKRVGGCLPVRAGRSAGGRR